jgi:hypothetical protein
MSATSRIAAGVTAGYLLGRFRKLKLAIIVGSAIANKRIVGSGLSSGLNKLSEASGGGGIGGKLLEAGKGAALATASHRIEALSDRMAERSEALRGGEPDEEAEPEDEEAEDEETDDEYEDEAEPEDEYEDEAEGEPEDEAAEDEAEPEDEDDLEDWDEDEEPEDEETEEKPRSRRKRS